jgi:hypothetical protein
VNPSTSIYSTVTVHLNKSHIVDVFPYYDPENGTVTVEGLENSTNPVNISVSSNYQQVTIFTTSFSQLGWHTLKIILRD